ncbi:uncharacterized protein LOC126370435 [Pectinophora gossypiella]|uniref:uncharacterized protein LOC126370435 n=1 Tax=Pectinophora gossypiella TaxID=13191 RepID=UPI00214EE5F5|nr:uncharacterized protein LOC126370435 [Pectinophora gossypiella]
MAGFGSYLDFFLILRESDDLKDYDLLLNKIVSKIPNEISEGDRLKIREFSREFTKRLTKKWIEANRYEKTFMNREGNRKWLGSTIKWPMCDTCDLNAIMAIPGETPDEDTENTTAELPIESVSTTDASTSTRQEKRVPFTDLSNKQKKRRSSSFVAENTEEELQYYYISKLKENGKSALAKIIEHLSNHTDSLEEVSKLIFKKADNQKPFCEDKSLALSTSLDLSKWKYLVLRKLLLDEGSTSLPSYQKLLEAKKRCYPSEEHVEVTETGARIRLQGLLDHTIKRIMQDMGPIRASSELKLTWKWGLDGSSSQSQYKQKSSNLEFDDSALVMTSIVPLRLVDSAGMTIWENPNPSSTFYCRPVKFTFISETASIIKTEHLEMEREISELVPTQCGSVDIVHELHMTMIDGKVANVIADVPSAATCPICLAKPSEMNNLGLLAMKPIRDDLCRYGISSLHMKIRSMECLLHISYNMDFQRWSARGEHKALKEAKKNATQQEFREETGLLIDIVKQGFGTTNDGNTARRFFQDYKRSSRITGIDENLILRFAVILQVIASEKKINIEKFRSYCKETAELFVHLYPWYYMPASVYKLLLHGAEICSHFGLLPIGTLSEEASEARNKDFRNVREKHTRKKGRIVANEDILYGLLISSDPHISRIRPKFSKETHQSLYDDAVNLLHFEDPDFEEEECSQAEPEDISDPLE